VKIVVEVKTNAKENTIQAISASHFLVRLKASPVQGKANRALINILASHFDIARSRITIVSGTSSHKKFVEII